MMAVYIDEPAWRWRGKLWCHMFADTLKELHVFATQKLGMKREWFQNHPSLPHYDVIETRRKKALKEGAIPVDRRFVYEAIKQRRQQNADKHKARLSSG